MSYEVKTPLLVESIAAAREAIAGIRTGAMDAATAARMLTGARALQTAVLADIRVRLAAPKIEAQEERLLAVRRLDEHAASGREAA